MTQGVLSVTKDGKVILKVVVGCGGFTIDRLFTRLKQETEFQLVTVDRIAEEEGFGCDDCRVVMNETDALHKSHTCTELSDLYCSTFNDPTFNPRWKRGTADYTRVLEL